MDLNDIYGKLGQLKQRVQDEQDQRNAAAQATIQPGDTSTPADSFRNQMIGGLGLPQDWQTTVAQQKMQAAQPQPIEAKMTTPVELGAAPEAEAGELAAQGAEKLAPQLKSWAQQMMGNPNAAIEVSGPINMNSFQKLRDALGHVGPVIMKGAK